jgi:hypothetical protein
MAEIEPLLDKKGGRDECVAVVVRYLRQGYNTPEFLNLVADPLDPPRGAPKRSEPRQWREIGAANQELLNQRLTQTEAHERLVKQFGIEKRTIESRIAFYREIDDINWATHLECFETAIEELRAQGLPTKEIVTRLCEQGFSHLIPRRPQFEKALEVRCAASRGQLRFLRAD